MQFHNQVQDVVLNPTVIVEVLSPSTAAFDRGEKFHLYRAWLPTLTDYVLVAQDRPVIDHYHRGDDCAVGRCGRWKAWRPGCTWRVIGCTMPAGRRVRAHRVPSGRGRNRAMMHTKDISPILLSMRRRIFSMVRSSTSGMW